MTPQSPHEHTPHPKKDTEHDPRESLRSRVSHSEGIESMRDRLYQRGNTQAPTKRTKLIDTSIRTPRTSWEQPPVTTSATSETMQDALAQTSMGTKRKKTYRVKLVLAGIFFFVVAMGLSSAFLYFGTNSISGSNIAIDVSGPFSIGGGEEIPIQISVANQNTVSIESATLIVEYPAGTQSTTERGKELFTERIPLNDIGTGEVVNVPARAIVYGEENEEKEVTVSVEYRVSGSNATFFKEADPLRFKINSSPVAMRVETVEKISSGEEIAVQVVVSSNAPTEITDILVKAAYPYGFDYSTASPEPVSGQDVWHIASLAPEETKVIDITGIIVGKQNDERVFNFSTGVPNERDPYALASIFSTTDVGVQMEDPFLGITVSVNGKENDIVVIEPKESAVVRINFTNTLNDTLYDGIVEAKLDGNALNEITINSAEGFYDSTTNTITWDSVDVGSLSELLPGGSSQVDFQLVSSKDAAQTPEINLEVSVKGRRVFEDRVPQELNGGVSRIIRVESAVTFASSVLHSAGPFTNTGPVPPVAEEVTQYTLDLSVENGSNDITLAEVTAVLPPYVTWLDLKTADDVVVYDAVNRLMTWTIGDMDANTRETASVQVSVTPSLNQIGTVPNILESQQFKATDRFTGTVLRASTPAITTMLLEDPYHEARSGGQVQAP